VSVKSQFLGLIGSSHITYWRKSGAMPQICVASLRASGLE
jgi:hypothetical protein